MGKKAEHIYSELLKRIQGGVLEPGERLPTEMQLVQEFGVSRPTVTKALNALQHQGYIERRYKAGSFVKDDNGRQAGSGAGNVRLGLAIPLLGTTEIFEPICARIAQLSHRFDYSLLWSGSHARKGDALGAELEQTCRRYISDEVAGVFLVPLEHFPESAEVNRRMIEMFTAADVPIVLIDSDVISFPKRSAFDLAGIDNVRNGYLAAQHYIEQGCTRVDYLHLPYSALTVEMRVRGFKQALHDAGLPCGPDLVHVGDPEDPEFVRGVLDSGAENIICANDLTAVRLMHTLLRLGVRVPDSARLVGFDDVKYARYAQVPLTTFHQPCDHIGDLAVQAMMLRLAEPRKLPMTFFAQPEFIARESSILP